MTQLDAADAADGGPAAAAVAPPPPPSAPPRHVAALDGLRGVAVLGVVLYHLPATWLPGGFLGVDVFFVLSGFLITGLLLGEHQSAGTVGLAAFWRRRARRLLPAALTAVLGTTVLASVFAKDALARLRGDVPASLAYVMNWRLIVHHDSYAQAFGRPPLLQHLWSLGVEEQFYVVWPLAVVGIAWLLRRRPGGTVRRLRRRPGGTVRRLRRRPGGTVRSAVPPRELARHVAAVASSAALVSGVLMAVMVRPGRDPSAVYFDPVTHAGGLLLGAALAAAFPLWRRSGSITAGARRVLEVSAGLAAAGLLALLLTLHQDGIGTYRGGLQVAELLCGLLVVLAGHPGTRLGWPLGRSPLVWLGRRSYSIYLWHWPVFEMTRPGVDLHLGAVQALALRLGLTVAAAEGSYRWVEQPWRTGRAQRALRQWRRQAAQPVVVTGFGVVGVLGLSVAVLLADAPGQATLALSSTPAGRATLPERGLAPAGTSGESATTAAGAHTRPRAGHSRRPPRVLPAPGPVLAIGDSVLLGASDDVAAALGPGTVVDAVVGRQVDQGLQRLEEYRAAGRLAGLGAVVVALGTNGPMTVDQCRQFLEVASGHRVVFVTVRVPRPWQDSTNAAIAACVAGTAGARTADWYGASGAPDVLGPDRVHETVAGEALYAGVLAAAVEEAQAAGRAEEARAVQRAQTLRPPPPATRPPRR